MVMLQRMAVLSLEFDLSRPFAGDIFSRRYGRGPSPLKVVSAEPAGYVDNFSDEIKSRAFLTLHTLARQFFCVHTTSRDFGLLVSFGSRWNDLPVVDAFFEEF